MEEPEFVKKHKKFLKERRLDRDTEVTRDVKRLLQLILKDLTKSLKEEYGGEFRYYEIKQSAIPSGGRISFNFVRVKTFKDESGAIEGYSKTHIFPKYGSSLNFRITWNEIEISKWNKVKFLVLILFEYGVPKYKKDFRGRGLLDYKPKSSSKKLKYLLDADTYTKGLDKTKKEIFVWIKDKLREREESIRKWNEGLEKKGIYIS